MGVDTEMQELLPPNGALVELDRGVPSMEQDFCRTQRELQGKLMAWAADSRPVFAYTLPQNVHIAVASKKKVPQEYPGFFAPVAESVREVDRCFGEFVTFLRRSKLYDESVIILTSDHGDSLGEEGRWGHSYFLAPEVMRIPLIVRLPPALRARFTTDLGRVSFSTDLTPTLYALLGHEPADLGSLFGVSLVTRRGTDPVSRRDESFLLASSYGAVYGVLRHNGRTLYIANGVDGRDEAYDLSRSPGRRIAVARSMAAENRQLMTKQLDRLAALNGFTPGGTR
jgi:arylsulfatase A-like enzyme